MKKSLLFGTALFLAVSSFAQNTRFTKPSGALDAPFINKEVPEPTFQNSSLFTGPVKKTKPAINSNAKIATVTSTNFTGSMNVLGYLLSTQKPLHWTKGINAISFV